MPYQQRTSGAQLPSAEELLDILHKESPRQALHFDYLQKYGNIFAAHREISRLAGSDDSWIETYPNLSLEELDKRVIKNRTELMNYINSYPSKTLYEQLYKCLIPELDDTRSDVIFVFGAMSNARVERAIELFHEGVAPQIILSGHGPHYGANDISESKRMEQVAIQHGVPKHALMLEEKSITLPDNVKRTLDLMETSNLQPKVITIIATDFVLSRAVMEWYKFTPWEVVIKPVAAYTQTERFTPEGWTKETDSLALVLNEYAKLIFESKIDLMRRDRQVQF